MTHSSPNVPSPAWQTRVKASVEKRGQRIEDFDVAIATHGLAFGATLVTANVKHMPRVAGLAIEDWSKG